MSDTLRNSLLAELQAIRTVDCHSHTCLSTEYAQHAPWTLFRLMSYFERDFAGALGKSSHEAYQDCTDDAQRWEVLRGVLDRCRNVSYWRHNLVMYQRFFGLEQDELTDHNWAAVNEAIQQRTAEPDWYRQVTEDVCNLETQVLNVPWFEDWEPRYFTCVLRMEPALELHSSNTRKQLETHVGRELPTLAAVHEALAQVIEEYRGRGSVGIKLAHAYTRTLASENVPLHTASSLYARAVAGELLSPAEIKALQDHLIFYLAQVAGELGQVFEIHTGTQGNWGVVPDSNPLHLIPLLLANRQTRFGLYHGGYPYSREIGMLGKHFPNVWLNMAWMYLVTMEGTRQSLSEWIDLVPGDRILGFGSDVPTPEFVYAHLAMARSCLADVLAQKVERDFLSEETALDLCHKLLRDNAMRLYNLKPRS